MDCDRALSSDSLNYLRGCDLFGRILIIGSSVILFSLLIKKFNRITLCQLQACPCAVIISHKVCGVCRTVSEFLILFFRKAVLFVGLQGFSLNASVVARIFAGSRLYFFDFYQTSASAVKRQLECVNFYKLSAENLKSLF